jgi:hypothetical protein
MRFKAWVAKEHGAKGMIVVDSAPVPSPLRPEWKEPDEAKLPALEPEGYGDAGIPVVVVKRVHGAPLILRLLAGEKLSGELGVWLSGAHAGAFNVVGHLPAGKGKLPGVVVIGAHYDHLGMGGRYSLAPDKSEPHLGADDNASGTATLLEVARTLVAAKDLKRDVLFVAFSGEESGVLGSTWFTTHLPKEAKEMVAMINLDMVGRLRENKVTILGTGSATEWPALLGPACDAARVECNFSGGDGYGPSDSGPFYGAGVPVAFFFTGTHGDYHKPSDVPARINAAGAAQLAQVVAAGARAIGARPEKLSYQKMPPPAPRGDLRSFNASLGTVPDYGGPKSGKGVLLSGVRAGGGAEKCGMQRGDVLTRLGTHEIGSVEDLMYVLNSSHPGETVGALVLRDGKEVRLECTFQESTRKR